MTYLTLLLVGLLPPGAALLAGCRRRNAAPSVPLRRQAAALALLVVLAVAATLPWDAALIARGTWSYPHGLLLGHLLGVPVEEVLFMVLQPILVGLWLRTRRPPNDRATTECTAHRVRSTGAGAWLTLGVAGALLTRGPHGSYLGWLLAGAAPLLALQWAVGGDHLWARRRLLLAGTAVPTLYLCALDRLALQLRLWELSSRRTSGLELLGLPLEEALFFLLTTLLVVGGLLLSTDPAALARVRAGLHRRLQPASPRPQQRRPAGAAHVAPPGRATSPPVRLIRQTSARQPGTDVRRPLQNSGTGR